MSYKHIHKDEWRVNGIAGAYYFGPVGDGLYRKYYIHGIEPATGDLIVEEV